MEQDKKTYRIRRGAEHIIATESGLKMLKYPDEIELNPEEAQTLAGKIEPLGAESEIVTEVSAEIEQLRAEIAQLRAASGGDSEKLYEAQNELKKTRKRLDKIVAYIQAIHEAAAIPEQDELPRAVAELKRKADQDALALQKAKEVIADLDKNYHAVLSKYEALKAKLQPAVLERVQGLSKASLASLKTHLGLE